MTLKIERIEAGIRLSGELRSAQLEQVRAQLQECGASAILDLDEVNLTDIEGVRFLNVCEANGVSVVNCSSYIKGWMLREREEKANTKQERRSI